MNRRGGVIVLVCGLIAGAAGGYWYARLPLSAEAPQTATTAGDRRILYYRDPSGAPYWSAEPKLDAGGRDWLPVHEDEEISFESGGKKPAAGGSRRILYYRNPMGLP